MGERITVIVDDKLMPKLRNIQAKKIQELKKPVSFSRVLNEIIESGLKKK